jgi:hypothetical protein
VGKIDFETKEEKRMADSILLILYEVHPMALQQDEIIKRINERGLLEMPDEEFQVYRRNMVKSKRN